MYALFHLCVHAGLRVLVPERCVRHLRPGNEDPTSRSGSYWQHREEPGENPPGHVKENLQLKEQSIHAVSTTRVTSGSSVCRTSLTGLHKICKCNSHVWESERAACTAVRMIKNLTECCDCIKTWFQSLIVSSVFHLHCDLLIGGFTHRLSCWINSDLN